MKGCALVEEQLVLQMIMFLINASAVSLQFSASSFKLFML